MIGILAPCVLLSIFPIGAISKTPLYIGGLLPLTKETHKFGEKVLPGIEIAIELINSREDILPDHELIVIYKDTQGNAGMATKKLFDLVYNDPVKIMLFGPLMSKEVVNVAAAAPAWNLLQMSCITRTPEMDDRDRYPMFFRTLPPDSNFNEARLRFIQAYKWKRVSMLYQSHPGNTYLSSLENLKDLLNLYNITVVSMHNIDNNPAEALEDIKRNDVRIIIASYYNTVVARMFCEAFKAGIYGKKYVWIVPGWMTQSSLDRYMARQDCDFEDVKMVAEGSFFFDNPEQRVDTNETVFGKSYEEFETEYLNRSSRSSVDEYAVYGFDGILSMALTLHKAMKRGLVLETFTYENDTYSSTFLDIMYNLNFKGLTGPVSFDANGNRIGITEIKQLQDGQRIHVADHFPFGDRIVLSDQNTIIWKGNAVPVDGTRKDILKQYIPHYAFIPFTLISVFGILLAGFFLVFNIRKRDLKYIKLSSPTMNNIIAVGCILAYLAVILYGLNTDFVSDDFFRINCKLRIWVLSCAFSLAFGAMFSKTWRVHLIMSKKTKQKIVVTDWQLAIKLLGLLVVDSIFLAIWSSVDPFVNQIQTFPDVVDPDDDDHVWQPQVSFCHSRYEVYWIGGIIVYKGLILMLGLFLAWETRNIRIEALNDSKHIGICVYNVALVCIMGLPVGFLIGDDQFVGGYVITSLFIILSTTITLCLVFVPKNIELRHNPFGDVNISMNPKSTAVPSSVSSKIAPLKEIPSTTTDRDSVELKKNIEETERQNGHQNGYILQDETSA